MLFQLSYQHSMLVTKTQTQSILTTYSNRERFDTSPLPYGYSMLYLQCRYHDYLDQSSPEPVPASINSSVSHVGAALFQLQYTFQHVCSDSTHSSPILCQYSRTSENWLNNTNFLIKYSEGYRPISPKLWKPISRKH